MAWEKTKNNVAPNVLDYRDLRHYLGDQPCLLTNKSGRD